MNMWWASCCVFLGAGLGGLGRFWTGVLMRDLLGWSIASMSIATIVVNTVGSFGIGLACAWVRVDLVKFFLIVGLLGGFTTFSAFSLEVLEQLRLGQLGLAFLHIGLSVVLGLTAVWAGWQLGLRLTAA